MSELPRHGGADDSAHDAVAVLQRWQDSGAVWRVVGRSPTQVAVSMCSCDGGEEVDRIVSSDPALLRFLAERDSSED